MASKNKIKKKNLKRANKLYFISFNRMDKQKTKEEKQNQKEIEKLQSIWIKR